MDPRASRLVRHVRRRRDAGDAGRTHTHGQPPRRQPANLEGLNCIHPLSIRPAAIAISPRHLFCFHFTRSSFSRSLASPPSSGSLLQSLEERSGCSITPPHTPPCSLCFISYSTSTRSTLLRGTYWTLPCSHLLCPSSTVSPRCSLPSRPPNSSLNPRPVYIHRYYHIPNYCSMQVSQVS